MAPVINSPNHKYYQRRHKKTKLFSIFLFDVYKIIPIKFPQKFEDMIGVQLVTHLEPHPLLFFNTSH